MVLDLASNLVVQSFMKADISSVPGRNKYMDNNYLIQLNTTIYTGSNI